MGIFGPPAKPWDGAVADEEEEEGERDGIVMGGKEMMGLAEDICGRVDA